MEKLIKLSAKRIHSVKADFKRFLYDNIDWGQSLIIIKGHRGTGKTTLLLQRAVTVKQKAIYLSLDDIYFENNRLADTIDVLFEKGYRYFFLDEVHRYQYWAKDLKISYDHYSEIKIVVTGSSVLEVNKGNADLSRRAASYYLPGLSFREFMLLDYNINLPAYKLEDVLAKHTEYTEYINNQAAVLNAFSNYLEYGYYPFFQEGKKTYIQKLRETANLVLDIDIAPIENLNYSTLRNMKKLLYIIGQSVPFTPNISKLAKQIQTPRNTVLKILDLLQQARIISLLRKQTKGISFMQKPEKVYLQNPNLAFALADSQPNVGNIRESFFFNQLEVQHKVTYSRLSDFFVDEAYTFELGGPTKTKRQIQGIPNSYLAADGIENGTGVKIPLWLFGFLY